MALERTDIVKAAIALLDAEGIDAVSTRRLAARLGVAGPSLYWHFANKDDLFNHMAEHIMAETMPAPDADYAGAWRDWLADGARAIRRAALAHRDGARLIAGSRLTGTHPIMNFPAMIARLQTEGFSRADAQKALGALGNYALGCAASEQNAAHGRRDNSGFEFGLTAMIEGIAAKGRSKRGRARARARV